MTRQNSSDRQIESFKNRIKVVQKEIKKESDPKKKARLNRYKQKLEIQYRDYTRSLNRY